MSGVLVRCRVNIQLFHSNTRMGLKNKRECCVQLSGSKMVVVSFTDVDVECQGSGTLESDEEWNCSRLEYKDSLSE